MSAHTPGPWKTEPHDDHVMITDAPTGMSAIARVGMRASWDWDRRQMAGANARVIAAAPDMLAALRKAKAALDGYEGECTAQGEAFDAVADAIKKAEGST